MGGRAKRAVEGSRSTAAARWVSLYPLVYLTHLIDERFFGAGTATWWAERTGVYFTNSGWLAVNIPSFALMTLAAWLVARRTWPSWVAVSLATHIALHALVRIWGTALYLSLSPGVLTGVALCLPLSIYTWRLAARSLHRTDLLRGAAVGLASFQPVWHTLLLPILPEGPPAA